VVSTRSNRRPLVKTQRVVAVLALANC
jgi:hypothetical protein